MLEINESRILEALRLVEDPDLKRDIVSLGFVKDIEIKNGIVSFKVELTTPACPVKDKLKHQCEEVVAKLPGVADVRVEMTARVRTTSDNTELLPQVKNVIAVASGKGGVGKSTVAVNLAIALSQTGAKVGLLDADVYGPSIPLMLGCASERPWTEAGKIIPIERFGLKLMSLGFLLEEGQAVLWRGPMVATTVRQLLADVHWGELDYLIVDLPPGTGDAPMTLAQQVPLTGVVIVMTPHDVAANIAGNSVALFRRLGAPILGVVENMAWMTCPHCGERLKVFAGMKGEELAKSLRSQFLGAIPLDPNVSQSGDQGIPSVIQYPDAEQAVCFKEISGRIAQEVSKQAFAEKGLTRQVDIIK